MSRRGPYFVDPPVMAGHDRVDPDHQTEDRSEEQSRDAESDPDGGHGWIVAQTRELNRDPSHSTKA
jgi:hypothetical protein